MPAQLTVRLPEDLSHTLAARRGQMQFPREHGATAADRVRGLIGSLDSGIPDLAENHRSYVLAALSLSALGRCRALIGKYADLPMDFTGATLGRGRLADMERPVVKPPPAATRGPGEATVSG